MTTFRPGARLGQVHEWERLQTTLHTREAMRSLRAAAQSIEDAAAAAPTVGHEFDAALASIGQAAAALARVDADMNAETPPAHRYG